MLKAICLLISAVLAVVRVAALSFPLNGADYSSLLLLESQGTSYSDHGIHLPFETILSANGFRLARIRVWTAEPYNQTYAISLARRAKAVGMKVLIDLHYSDTC